MKLLASFTFTSILAISTVIGVENVQAAIDEESSVAAEGASGGEGSADSGDSKTEDSEPPAKDKEPIVVAEAATDDVSNPFLEASDAADQAEAEAGAAQADAEAAAAAAETADKAEEAKQADADKGDLAEASDSEDNSESYVTTDTGSADAGASDSSPTEETELAADEEGVSLQKEAIDTALENVIPAEAAKYVDPKTGEFDYATARAETDPATAREYRSAWKSAYADAAAETA